MSTPQFSAPALGLAPGAAHARETGSCLQDFLRHWKEVEGTESCVVALLHCAGVLNRSNVNAWGCKLSLRRRRAHFESDVRCDLWAHLALTDHTTNRASCQFTVKSTGSV